MPDKTIDTKSALNRRSFLKGVGTGAASVPVLEQAVEAASQEKRYGPAPVPITLHVNGNFYKVQVEPRETLLEVLRYRLDITGPKVVCDGGSCGACTVYLDGEIVYSCMMLAIKAQGKKITTIEGLSDGQELHPVQKAFIDTDATQCGFCTPGFIMSMAKVFEENPEASLIEVKAGIAGHICRCGTYAQIFKAAENLAERKDG